MKNLAAYLLESEQTYDFKIKIAGIELNNDALDRIEHALKAFDVSSISKPKRLPMCDKPMDFPSFGPVEVSIITASLKYPCTDEQVRTSLGSQGRFPLSNIVVVPKNSPEELRREEESEACESNESTNKKEKKSKLETEIENVSGGQIQVGTKRVDSMMKEFETRKMEFASKEKTSAPKTSNDYPQNNTSILRKGKK